MTKEMVSIIIGAFVCSYFILIGGCISTVEREVAFIFYFASND